MIKTTIYMAMSVNGLINGPKGETPWGANEWEKYSQALGNAGCLIVGSRTHKVMDEQKEYEKLGIKRVVIFTRKASQFPLGMTTAATPQEAITQLEKEGFKQVIVGGGAETNAAFLKLGIADELILDIEPFLFGGGLPLFSHFELNQRLELIETKRYSSNSLGLKYKILHAQR